MALYAAIGACGEDRQKAAFTITATATNLNRHGAAVQLNRELQAGSVVNVKNQRGIPFSAPHRGATARTAGSPLRYRILDEDDTANELLGNFVPHMRLAKI
jgi:hypothetical protein